MAEPTKHRLGTRGLCNTIYPKRKNVRSGTIPKSYSLEDVGQRLPSVKLTASLLLNNGILSVMKFPFKELAKGLFNFHPGAILRSRESIPIIKRSHFLRIGCSFPLYLDLVKVMFTFYRGKSPLNHNLGENCFLFPGILSKSKS